MQLIRTACALEWYWTTANAVFVSKEMKSILWKKKTPLAIIVIIETQEERQEDIMYTLVRWRWPRNAGVVTTAYDSVTLLVARQEFIHLTCYSDKQTSGFKDHRTSCEKFVVLLSSEFNSSQTNLSHYHELSITSPFSHHKVLRCPGRHQVTQQPHHNPLL